MYLESLSVALTYLVQPVSRFVSFERSGRVKLTGHKPFHVQHVALPLSPSSIFPATSSPSLRIVIPIIIMALGTQGYPRNPQLLVPPFSQSPPQSSTDLWADMDPVRYYFFSPLRVSRHALLSSILSFTRSHHFPRKAPNLSALCNHFLLHGTKVVVQPDPPSLIAQKTTQATRVAQIAMATENSGNPSPS